MLGVYAHMHFVLRLHAAAPHLVSVGVGVFGRPRRRSGRTSFPFDMKRKCERLQRKKKEKEKRKQRGQVRTEGRRPARTSGTRELHQLVTFGVLLSWSCCTGAPLHREEAHNARGCVFMKGVQKRNIVFSRSSHK